MAADPVSQQIRGDGRVEWVCEHGVGHTVFVQLNGVAKWNERASYIHGCDGCCGQWRVPNGS